jgi:hypothetical protein
VKHTLGLNEMLGEKKFLLTKKWDLEVWEAALAAA